VEKLKSIQTNLITPLLPQTKFKPIPELIILLETNLKRQMNKQWEQTLIKSHPQLLEFNKSQ
jgi:hypothetical protein